QTQRQQQATRPKRLQHQTLPPDSLTRSEGARLRRSRECSPTATPPRRTRSPAPKWADPNRPRVGAAAGTSTTSNGGPEEGPGERLSTSGAVSKLVRCRVRAFSNVKREEAKARFSALCLFFDLGEPGGARLRFLRENRRPALAGLLSMGGDGLEPPTSWV